MDHSSGQSDIRVWVYRPTPTTRCYQANICLNNPKRESLWFGQDDHGMYQPLTEDRKQEVLEEYKFPRQAIELAYQIMQMRQPDGELLFHDVFIKRDQATVFPIADQYWPDIDLQIAELIKSIFQSVV